MNDFTTFDPNAGYADNTNEAVDKTRFQKCKGCGCGVQHCRCMAKPIERDNCYYRCATCGTFVHYSEKCSCRPAHEYDDTCGCVWCMRKTTQEAVDRMRAATCKCGHVGAECFNDSFCEPVPTVAAERTCGAYARRLENQVSALDAALQNALTEIEAMRGVINDLQADYASDCTTWEANCSALNDAFFGDTRTEQLEITIKVLSGMIE